MFQTPLNNLWLYQKSNTVKVLCSLNSVMHYLYKEYQLLQSICGVCTFGAVSAYCSYTLSTSEDVYLFFLNDL